MVLTTQSEKPDTFKFKLIEALNVDVLKSAYGDSNVTGTLEAGITIKANSTEQEECVLVFEIILKNKVHKRIVVPKSKVTEVSEIVYKDGESIDYETTMNAAPDKDSNTH